jgi:hypothetical protein
MRLFVQTLTVSPPDLAGRLDAIWQMSVPDAALALHALVSDTVDLIEKHMPTIDTAGARKSLARNDVAWTTASDTSHG